MFGVAIIGAGRIGRVHAQSVAAHPEAELVWVCDPVRPAAEAVTSRWGGRATSDVDQVLGDPRVDGVVVASPASTHVELLVRSAEAGKPVLCEKPIDLDLPRVEQCWRDIARHRPWVMLGFNRRFDPTFRQVHRRVSGGEIGTLRALRITSRDPQAPLPAYLAAAGGIFRDTTIHDFDLARHFLGEIVEVYAAVADDGREDLAAAGHVHQAMLVLRSADGALCTVTNSLSCAFGYDQRVEAFGDAGMLEAANQSASSIRAYTSSITEAADPYLHFFLERYRGAFQAELDEFIDAVRAGRPASPGFADGWAALVLAQAAGQSAASGHAVSVVTTEVSPMSDEVKERHGD